MRDGFEILTVREMLVHVVVELAITDTPGKTGDVVTWGWGFGMWIAMAVWREVVAGPGVRDQGDEVVARGVGREPRELVEDERRVTRLVQMVVGVAMQVVQRGGG